MRSLAGSLADGVLADTILIPLRPPILPTNIKKASSKKVRKQVTEKTLLVNDVGMAKCFFKKYGNKG